MNLFYELNGRCSNSVFITFVILTILLNLTCLFLFYKNFEGTGKALNFYSDSINLPFPLLFKEFDISNENAFKSQTNKHLRAKGQRCYRRLLKEYQDYRLKQNYTLEHVSNKRLVTNPKRLHTLPCIYRLILRNHTLIPEHPEIEMADSTYYTFIITSSVSWHPVICLLVFLVLLDGMRFDYVVNDPLFDNTSYNIRSIFINHMSIVHKIMSSKDAKDHYRLLKLNCSYPTLTVSALKTILTGSTCNTGSIVENNNPTGLVVDCFPYQCKNNDRIYTVIGDVTGYNLAIDYVTYTHNNRNENTVNDIYIADNLVFDRYKNYIDKSDIMFLHLVGLDHLGHCGRRLTPEMTAILKTYNNFLEDLVQTLNKRTKIGLFVFGDHGQRSNGNHGGRSVEETEAFLFIFGDGVLRADDRDYCLFSQEPVGYRLDHSALNGKVHLDYPLGDQSNANLTSTISLLSNIPIPYRSEGLIIPSAIPYISTGGKINKELSEKYYVQLHHINVHSVLRLVDTTIPSDCKGTCKATGVEIYRGRMKLVNLFNLIKIIDGSNDWNFKEKVYKDYVDLCREISINCRNLILDVNNKFEPCILSMVIILQFMLIITAVYLYAWVRTGLNAVLLGLVRNAIITLIATCLSLHCEPEIIQKYNSFMIATFHIVEPNVFFRPIATTALFLSIFFIKDLPSLIERMCTTKGERTADQPSLNGIKDMVLSFKAFRYSVGKLNFDRVITFFYMVTMILIVTSECACNTHDLVSRHLFMCYLFLGLGPKILRDCDSNDFKRLLIILVTSKIASIFHNYRLFLYFSSLAPQTWIFIEESMNKLEVVLATLLIFYFILQLADIKCGFPIKLAWFSQFLLLLLYYILAVRTSATGIHKHLKMHLLKLGNNFTTVSCSVAILILTVLSFLITLSRSADNALLNRFVLNLPNLCWLLFLLIGYKRILHVLFFFITLYQCSSLIVSKNTKLRISHIILIYTICDVFYFSSAHIDNIFDLPFESAFIFTNTYISEISDVTVFFNVFGFHLIGSYVLTLLQLKMDDRQLPNKGNGENAKGTHFQSPQHLLAEIIFFALLSSVKIFVILLIVVKLNEDPRITNVGFPKALFLSARAIICTIFHWLLYAICKL